MNPEVAPDAADAAQSLALLAGGVVLAPLGIWLARKLFPGRNIFFARWGFSHLAVALALIGAATFASPVLLGALGWSSPTPVQMLALQSVLFFPALAWVFGAANRLDPDGWRSLGFGPGRWFRASALGVLAYLASIPFLLGVHGVWRYVLEASGAGYSEQELASQARDLAGPELAAFAVLAVVVAPAIEELLFRAFLQPLLVQNLGDRGGVVVTALVFAAAHASLGAFAPIFALGLLLGALMLRTQRVIAPFAAHALHNGIMVLALAQNSSAS